MKTFKMIGMALLAIVMSAGFTACSKEAPQYELVTGGKKITHLEIDDPNSGYLVYDFKYDNKGKLSEVAYRYDMGETNKFNYNWSNNTIESSNGTYTLNNGLISNWNDSKDVRYSEVCVIESLLAYDYEYKFVWDSDIEGLSRRDKTKKEENRWFIDEIFSFIYDTDVITCNGYNPLVPIFLSDGFSGDRLCVAHPELIDARTYSLPSRFEREDYWREGHDSETIRGTITYRFDGDGYVTECIMSEGNTDGYAYGDYMATYYISWE